VFLKIAARRMSAAGGPRSVRLSAADPKMAMRLVVWFGVAVQLQRLITVASRRNSCVAGRSVSSGGPMRARPGFDDPEREQQEG
jgi:hypothetical protein